MKAYILAENQRYNNQIGLYWEDSQLSVEDCIKKYAGIRTIQLIWEDESRRMISTIIKSQNDISQDNEAIASAVSDFFKNKLIN